MKAVQPLVSAEQLLRHGNYMRRIVLAGTKLDQIAGSSASYGSARGVAGKFCSIQLDPASVAKLASPMALLILASAIAEQKKWEATERSLTRSRSPSPTCPGSSRRSASQSSKGLQGSIRYSQQVAPSVLGGELEPEVLQQIEGHEVDLVQAQEHLAQDLRTQIASLRSIRKDTFGGSSKYTR